MIETTKLAGVFDSKVMVYRSLRQIEIFIALINLTRILRHDKIMHVTIERVNTTS